jgi:putative transposase
MAGFKVTTEACRALGVPRASLYRRMLPAVPRRVRPTPGRAPGAAERQVVLDHLHSERFCDKAPAEAFATRLDEDIDLCSIRTMHRILAQKGELKERRNQLRHPQYKKPELLATGPHQVWSWDITKLLGPAKWTYFHLYVILDIFSRYVLGWMVAPRETAELAKRLIADPCAKQGIVAGDLTLHADRGTSMTSKPIALLLADLGVTQNPQSPPRFGR